MCFGVGINFFAKTKIVFLLRDNTDDFSLLLEKRILTFANYRNPCNTDDVRVELIHFFPRMHN